MRPPWRILLAVLLVTGGVVVNCSGEPPPTPSLSVSARPGIIDEFGQTSTIRVTATQADGTPGSGSVSLSSAAGSLKAGTTLTLSSGIAETPFTCAVAADPGCQGQVAITAQWNGIMATRRIFVGDAGIPGTGGGAGGGGGDGGTAGGTGGGGGSAGDGGMTDAGPSDGGATDGGPIDSGVPDAGPPDAGTLPPSDGGLSNTVRLFGKLTATNPPTWAVAPLETPSAAQVGFPSGAFATTAVVRPSGTVIYLDELNDQLWEFVPDFYEAGPGGTAVYPTMPTANDTPFNTSPCSSGNGVSDFWVWPDTGGVVYRCANTMSYYENGGEISELAGLHVFALGFDGLVLARNVTTQVPLIVDTTNGMTRSIQGASQQFNFLYMGRQRSVRATTGGFFVVFGQPGPNEVPPCNLWRIDFNTGMGLVDTYNLSAGSTCVGRLDAQLNLYALGTVSGDTVVTLHPRMLGPTSTVYTEAGATPSSFATNPPTVFTFFEPGSSLITGP